MHGPHSSQIAQERRLFSGVSDEGKAERLGKAGNTINASKNAEVARQAAQAQELYDKLSTRAGDVDGVLNQAARELAGGKETPYAIKSRAYEAVRAALSQALAGSEGSGPGPVQKGPSGGGQDAPSPRRGQVRELTGDDSLTIPGMESAVESQKEAAAAQRGENLSRELQKPLGSIDRKAGEMERNSPLFGESEANPQKRLFDFRAARRGESEVGRQIIAASTRDVWQNLSRSEGTVEAAQSPNTAPALSVNADGYHALELSVAMGGGKDWIGITLRTSAAADSIAKLQLMSRMGSGIPGALKLASLLEAARDASGGVIVLAPDADHLTRLEEQFHAWDYRNFATNHGSLSVLRGNPLFGVMEDLLLTKGYGNAGRINPFEVAAEAAAQIVTGKAVGGGARSCRSRAAG